MTDEWASVREYPQGNSPPLSRARIQQGGAGPWLLDREPPSCDTRRSSERVEDEHSGRRADREEHRCVSVPKMRSL